MRKIISSYWKVPFSSTLLTLKKGISSRPRLTTFNRKLKSRKLRIKPCLWYHEDFHIFFIYFELCWHLHGMSQPCLYIFLAEPFFKESNGFFCLNIIHVKKRFSKVFQVSRSKIKYFYLMISLVFYGPYCSGVACLYHTDFSELWQVSRFRMKYFRLMVRLVLHGSYCSMVVCLYHIDLDINVHLKYILLLLLSPH